MKTPAPHYMIPPPKNVSLFILPTKHLSVLHCTVYTYLRRRTLPSQPLDLPILIDLVVLEDGQLGLLPLMLDLLRGRVDLLLSLLGPAS